MGEVRDLTRSPRGDCPAHWPHDPYADIIVIDQGEAFSMRPDSWLAFVVQASTRPNADPAAFGYSLGEVAGDIAAMTPIEAAALAASFVGGQVQPQQRAKAA